METTDDEEDDDFPPAKRLEASNTRLIEAGIETIPNMETLQECVAYENTHQNRTHILRLVETLGPGFLPAACSSPPLDSA